MLRVRRLRRECGAHNESSCLQAELRRTEAEVRVEGAPSLRTSGAFAQGDDPKAEVLALPAIGAGVAIASPILEDPQRLKAENFVARYDEVIVNFDVQDTRRSNYIFGDLDILR